VPTRSERANASPAEGVARSRLASSADAVAYRRLVSEPDVADTRDIKRVFVERERPTGANTSRSGGSYEPVPAPTLRTVRRPPTPAKSAQRSSDPYDADSCIGPDPLVKLAGSLDAQDHAPRIAHTDSTCRRLLHRRTCGHLGRHRPHGLDCCYRSAGEPSGSRGLVAGLATNRSVCTTLA
jgi:hypothetical protein